MDKLDFFRDSQIGLNRDISDFGVGTKYFQPKPGKTFLLWKQWRRPLGFSSFLKIRLKVQLLVKMVIEDNFKSKPNYVDLVKLIRSIQRAEGNIDCYGNGWQQCERTNCAWRDHCLMAPGEQSTSPVGSRDKAER